MYKKSRDYTEQFKSLEITLNKLKVEQKTIIIRKKIQ